MKIYFVVGIDDVDNGSIITVTSENMETNYKETKRVVVENNTYSYEDRTRKILSECILRGYDSWIEAKEAKNHQESVVVDEKQSSSEDV